MEEGDSLDAGCEIDQFVVDVVATILSWSTTAIPKVCDVLLLYSCYVIVS